MAVIESNQTVSTSSSGFEKTINKTAKKMVLDNSQLYMYTKPIQSAVRECVSNGADSIKEKNIAIKILKGEADVKDHYLTQDDVRDKIANEEDNIYSDSEFNPDYYDLKWLNSDDSITIKYINKDVSERDQFVIMDNGVGLGGTRLEGFFEIGYSSKRLNSNELGGWGLGAKSPLATGVESFRLISRYNGMEFCYDIYSHKVDCVYSKWNEDGTANDFYEFKTYTLPDGSPIKAYYKKTYEKNSVTILIDVRKHNRQQFIEAVSSQLMYLKEDIKFFDVYKDGSERAIDFKADILYEDDTVVISNSRHYARPHFVIKNVSYGLIDFNELDLSQKFGNIGIKVKMEDIQVTPSRESVIYSTKTRNAVVEQYEKVSKIIEGKIQDSLNQDKLIDWIKACNTVLHTTNNSSSVIGRMSALIDKSDLKPTFKDSDIQYTSDVKSFITPILSMQHITLTSNYDRNKGKYVKKVSRTDLDSILGFDRALYFQFGPGISRVTTYLAGYHQNNGGCCTIRVNQNYSYLDAALNRFATGVIDKATFIIEAKEAIWANETDGKKIQTLNENVVKASQLVELLKNQDGASTVKIYSEDLVPEGFKVSESDADELTEDFEAIAEAKRRDDYKEIAKRRKENKIFIGSTLANKRKGAYTFEGGFERNEIKVANLDFDNCNIVYGTDDDSAAFDVLLELEQRKPTHKFNVYQQYYWNETVKVIKVAKSNLKFIKTDGTHINDYIMTVDANGKLSAATELKELFTAAAIKDALGVKHHFLTNFREFSVEIANTYDKLMTYSRNKPGISLITENTHSPLINTLKKAYEVQLQFLQHPSMNEEDRQNLIDRTIPSDMDLDVMDIDLIDTSLYAEAVQLREFIDVYGSILWYIEPLKDNKLPIIKDDLAIEIKTIIDGKKDQLEFKYENINQ